MLQHAAMIPHHRHVSNAKEKAHATNLLGKIMHILTVTSLFVTGSALAQEKKIKHEDLPTAVQKAVAEQSQGEKICGLSSEVENGQIVYEIEMLINEHTKDVLMDAAGMILTIEEQVSLASLPAAVQSPLKLQAGNGRIKLVEVVSKGGTITFYEVQIRNGRSTKEVKVSPEGQVVK